MTRKELGFILFYLFFLPFAAFSQSGIIRGTILDAENGEALIGATAQIEGTSKGARDRSRW